MNTVRMSEERKRDAADVVHVIAMWAAILVGTLAGTLGAFEFAKSHYGPDQATSKVVLSATYIEEGAMKRRLVQVDSEGRKRNVGTIASLGEGERWYADREVGARLGQYEAPVHGETAEELAGKVEDRVHAQVRGGTEWVVSAGAGVMMGIVFGLISAFCAMVAVWALAVFYDWVRERR